MNEQIAQRIARDLGLSDLTELLAENLSGSDLHSLLLTVIKRRVSKFAPAQLTVQNSLAKSCDLDGRLLNLVERIAYDSAAAFDGIELSPVSPLGAVAVLTGLDQANVLSTLRAFECASDPTIGLALECARRRKNPSERKNSTRVCTNQRVVRFPLPQTAGFTAHFKLFSLVTAGRDSGSFSFEVDALREHIATYLSFLSNLKTSEFSFAELEVEISDTRAVEHLCSMHNVNRDEIRSVVRARDSSSASKLLERYSVTWPKAVTKPAQELAQYNLPEHLMVQLGLLEEKVCASLSSEHSVRCQFNMHRLTGLGYYNGPCFHIKVTNDQGQSFALADGGFVDWTQQLLGDRKERLLTSGVGTELLCRMFRTK